MKVKVSHVMATFAAVFLLAFSAQAQETMDAGHREYSVDEDKALIYDHSTHATLRDSLQSFRINPATPNTSSSKISKSDVNKKEEEDALSFNFIYYIIQKFKMSDLIDK